jgi:DNA primase
VEQARLLRRFVDRVILCFDSDTAGQNAVERSLPALLSAGIEVKVARLPSGEDPDSLIRNRGVETFREQLSSALNFFDHTIHRAIEGAGGTLGPRERAITAQRLGGYLPLLPEVTLRETTTAHVAAWLGISAAALLEAGEKNPVNIADWNEGGEPASTASSVSLWKTKPSPSTELICRLAILSPEVRDWLSGQTRDALNETDPDLAILEVLLPPLQSLGDPSPSALLGLLPPDLQRMVSGWELETMPDNPLAAVKDAFRGLKLNQLKKRQADVAIELRIPGLNSQKMVAIQKEILDLQAMINEISAPAT